MLEGLVQHDHPLTLQHILRRMRRMYGDSEVVTLTDDGTTRASYGEVCDRIDRLCGALRALGIQDGDRVATFAWNSQRHLEAYMGVPCMGAVLHTLNIRLFEEQLTYIANHAKDKVVLVDDSLVPLLEKVAPRFETVEHYVVMGDGDIPLRRILPAIRDAGYDGYFDIELIGPAIEEEGYESVVPRANAAFKAIWE